MMTMLGSDAQEQARSATFCQLKKEFEKEYCRRKYIFKQSSCAADICPLSLLIGGSCIDVVSEYVVTKLGLRAEPDPESYQVAWVKIRIWRCKKNNCSLILLVDLLI